MTVARDIKHKIDEKIVSILLILCTTNSVCTSCMGVYVCNIILAAIILALIRFANLISY